MGGETMCRNVHGNVLTSFVREVSEPVIGAGAYVHPMGVVIGAVTLGRRVFVGPFASVRGDEGVPIFVGDDSNVQDGAMIHALETFEGGEVVEKNLREVDGKWYAVYVGRGVSLAHQCQVHGPAVVRDGVFVGMQALVFGAEVGEGCVIEPGAKVMGVVVPAGRYVPAGMVVVRQDHADELPKITEDYPFCTLNDGVVHVNVQLAESYLRKAEGEGSF